MFSLRKIFTENIGLKIIAIILATGIVRMKYEDGSSTLQVDVDVRPIYPNDQVLMTEPVEKVTVTLEGKYAQIRGFDPRTIEPFEPNLSGITQGQFNFKRESIKLPPGLSVVKVDPPAMLVSFEPRKTRSIPIEATLEGEPHSGYRVVQHSIRPESITISGAESVVNNLQRVQTERISLVGRMSSTTLNVDLAAPPNNVKYLDPPEKFEVQIEIEEIRGSRGIADRPIEIRGLVDSEYEAFPDVVYITLAGPVRLLDAYNRDSLVPYIDVSGLNLQRQAMRKQGIRVHVDPPPGLTVSEIKPDTVRIFRRDPPPTPAPAPEAVESAKRDRVENGHIENTEPTENAAHPEKPAEN